MPVPIAGPGEVLIKSSCSLISPGTERMLLQFGKASLIGKARQQPDRVKEVFDKVKVDGIGATIDSVLSKLDKPIPLGYCNVGTVVSVGDDVEGLSIGDRVVSNGAHAEYVSVPKNLCAKIPQNVDDSKAVFTVLGSISLHGVRLADPTLDEKFCVMGLGLVGLLAVQILLANGCQVIASDYDPKRLKLAEDFGATTVDLTNPESQLAGACHGFSDGRGIDGVIIAAHTTESKIMKNAATICRRKARIILIGSAGLELSRSDFYEKELSFKVSCSYGPGRYDQSYEAEGKDYPFEYVRWTQNRNFEAILNLLKNGKLVTDKLLTHTYDFSETEKIYSLLDSHQRSLGVLLKYPLSTKEHLAVNLEHREVSMKDESSPGDLKSGADVNVALIGAGNYARKILVPALSKTSSRLQTIVSEKGVSAVGIAKKFGFDLACTDADRVFSDPSTDAILIATRHDSHSNLVIKSMAKEKNVFVEKPLCLTIDELEEISELKSEYKKVLMVGFNRRFSPLVQTIKKLLASGNDPKTFLMVVNAGSIPSNHWTQNKEIGGGRVIGEFCHFVDLIRFLAGTSIVNYKIAQMKSEMPDCLSVSLMFQDGSIGIINYLSNGHRSYPKENLEIFTGGKILKLDNFKKLSGYGWKSFVKESLWKQNKGNQECIKSFIDAVKNRSKSPIPFNELIEVTRVTIEIAEALR